MDSPHDARWTLGGFVFRWRSYVPVLVILALASGVATGQSVGHLEIHRWVVGGLLVAAAGLALRLYAVGHAPPGTSGRHRRQYAERLNTFGIYSIVRHPLYLGNVLVWCGVSLTAAWAAGAAASALLAVAVFALIVRHEDAFLAARFGEAFREWSTVTPAVVPRWRLWRTARRPFRWRRAVASEYSTLHSIGLITMLFEAVRRVAAGSRPGLVWWCLLVANSALYVALRVWRRGSAAQAHAGARAAAEREGSTAA
jgi:protein-S-isoprenylcysteine O-methyltransferase Ste14